jgi:hypothetical protein
MRLLPLRAQDRNGAIEESGKVDRIRDNFFGSQMRDYDGRFQRLDERLAQEAAEARADVQRRIEGLETFLNGEVQSLAHRLNAKQSDRHSATEKLCDAAAIARAANLNPTRIHFDWKDCLALDAASLQRTWPVQCRRD